MSPELFTHLNGDYRERACTPPPETHLVGTLESAMTAVRRYVEDKPYENPRASWRERLDECLAEIRAELSPEKDT